MQRKPAGIDIQQNYVTVDHPMYLIDITVANIFQSFTHKMAPKTSGIDMELNYVIVTLCINE